MKVRDFLLKNGLRLEIVELPYCNSVSVGIFLPAGIKYDPLEKAGIAHLAEHLALCGTKKYPSSKVLSFIFKKNKH